MKTINFYSREETTAIQKALDKGLSNREIAVDMSKKFNRPYNSVYTKVMSTRNGKGMHRVFTGKGAIILPPSSSFEFVKVKKVVLNLDRTLTVHFE